MHFLVLQHLGVEHPGYFRDLWRQEEITWETVELDKGDPMPTDLTGFDAMVVMGGPMDVWETYTYPWLLPELAAIRQFVRDLERPYLGVCLGHQLLAEALGGEVTVASRSEVGPTAITLLPDATHDLLLKGVCSPLDTFQWHSSMVSKLPPGAIPLATNGCCPVQAFRWGTFAYGLQFHAEITENTVREWGEIDAYVRALEEVYGEGALQNLETRVATRLAGYRITARTLSDNFLHLVRMRQRATGSMRKSGYKAATGRDLPHTNKMSYLGKRR